jgi:RND family efflux transporter MFP subunit
MAFLRKRWVILTTVIVVLGIPGAWLLARDSGTEDSSVVARVRRGEFKVTVTISGELRAPRSVKITGPPGAQQANQHQMKIVTIVPEGTQVKAGDVVAELDRSNLANRMNDVNIALTKAQAVAEQAMLDSTLNLSKAREDIKTMEFGLEEKRLAKEQAVYEAPTVRRQAEIDLEKAQRALAQAKMDYKTKTEQAQAKMREVGADVQRQQNILRVATEVSEGFTVKAPAPGMVIYERDWSGKKKTAGSQVNVWDGGVVATLPDLSLMESMTYVNEIDVRRVAVGQPVTISLDSDPGKKLTGKVTSVANVGEQRPNSDAKVFEVKVEVAGTDTTLRPGMTTGNTILTDQSDNVLAIPIEALYNEGGVSFVFKQSGARVEKQEVEPGTMNDDEVVILRGLEEDDRVLLTAPLDRDKISLVRLPGSTAGDSTRTPVGGDTAVDKVPIPPASQPAAAPVRPPAARP